MNTWWIQRRVRRAAGPTASGRCSKFDFSTTSSSTKTGGLRICIGPIEKDMGKFVFEESKKADEGAVEKSDLVIPFTV